MVETIKFDNLSPKLKLVTITGADDSTSIQRMIDLSEEFPFVEWGILVSESQEGSYRFPSEDWIMNFLDKTIDKPLNVSTHLCGKWVRELFKGSLNWEVLPGGIQYFSQRMQINTHSDYHELLSPIEFGKSLMIPIALGKTREFIFQWDEVNNASAYAVKDILSFMPAVNVTALFDTSGGAGILPEEWPQAPTDIRVGFAGGLGPDNVVDQLAKIRKVATQDFWIDMERRVRTEGDSALDMAKVKDVLRLMKNEVDI